MLSSSANHLFEIPPSKLPIANLITQSTIHRVQKLTQSKSHSQILPYLDYLVHLVYLPIFLYELKRNPQKANLDVKHRVGNVGVKYNTTLIRLLLTTLSTNNTSSRGSRGSRIELLTEVAARTGTHQIGVVRRRTDADSLSGPAEEVAQVVRENLQDIRGTEIACLGGLRGVRGVENLVPDGEVVCGTRGSLQGGVCLQVEVPVAGLGDAAVDDGARLGVEGLFGFRLLCCVKPSVVPLANDHDGHAWEALLGVGGRVRGSAGLLQEGKLLVDHGVVLAL